MIFIFLWSLPWFPRRRSERGENQKFLALMHEIRIIYSISFEGWKFNPESRFKPQNIYNPLSDRSSFYINCIAFIGPDFFRQKMKKKV
jgi:hypothetical protein